MNGFFNRVLHIDLSQRSTRYEDISDSVLERTLGGKGLGARLLSDHNPSGVDPLSPDARFIVAVGPVTGTRMWSQSRFGVFAKSPATGGYGESYCGGILAPKIKGCRVDALVIHGKAESPVCLSISEDGVSYLDSTEIAGAESYTAEDWLLGKAGSGSGAMVIGPAGENLVRCACIKSDRWRSLGRGGMGAVLGSKNVKGIAFRGGAQAEVADEASLRELIRLTAKKGRESPVSSVYQTYGTPSQVAVTNKAGCFPTRYWQSGRYERWENLSADYMLEHFDVSRHGCPTCFLQCTKKTKVLSGRHKGLEIDGPEYETIYALGGLNCVEPLEEVAYLNDVCDRMGLDTMSAGNLTAFAAEASLRGISDYHIEYGDVDAIADLLNQIAYRRDFGAVLADGITRAAASLGPDAEDLAVHVKGLEPAGFDPRVLKGMGLSYATAARGACHLRGTFYKAELSGQMAPKQIAGKAELLIDYEDRAALFDSLILCRFFRDFILWDEIQTLVRATTGLDVSTEDLRVVANRITELTRSFNRREGLGAATDTLPRRLLREATKEGHRITPEELAALTDDYNKIRAERSVPQ